MKKEKPKLRVAAYCRVSTDSDEQTTSYEAQIEHYTTYIKANLKHRPFLRCPNVTAINDTLSGKDAFLSTLQDNIAIVLSKENDQTLTDIDNRLEELQTQLWKLASSKAGYEDVADEIYRLREQKHKVQMENAIGMNLKSAWPI